MPREGADYLPPDCWQLVFKNLNEEDLETVSLVCKSFLANSNLVKESFINVFGLESSKLSQLFRRFTQLKKVNLLGYFVPICFDKSLVEVGRSGLNLESLNISYPGVSLPLKTESVRELVSNPNMKNLKSLSCNWITSLHEDDLQEFTNSFPSLEELHIDYKYRDFDLSVDKRFEVLASKFKFLKKFHISGNHPISDQFVVSLSGNCPLLKDVAINVSPDHGVTETGIGLLLRKTPNLEALLLGYIKINDSSSAESSAITIENSISHAKGLASLEFQSMDISDRLLIAVADSRLRLEYLGIKYSDEVIGSGFWFNYSTKLLTDKNIPLPTHNKIRQFHLQSCGICDEGVKQLGLAFPNIKVLDLSGCYKVTSTGIEAILKSCKSIRELILNELYNEEKNIIEPDSDLPKVNLEVLTLWHSSIDGKGLAVIEKKCPRLVDLDLSFCRNVTTKDIKQLVQNIKTLTYLGLICCNQIHFGDLFKRMLSTGNLASLKEIYVELPKLKTTKKEQRDQFLRHGCLLRHDCPRHSLNRVFL